ncbi:MAG: hypothetical protein AAF984_07265 [Verrucomicrobiota bacterium]
MYTTTRSDSHSFTLTHAKYLASKIATDMHRCYQNYGDPQKIEDYQKELTQLLNNGYVSEYEFGYKKDGYRFLSWHYVIDENGIVDTDDRPGKIVSNVKLDGAAYFNFLWPSSKWHDLSQYDKSSFYDDLSIDRTPGSAPQDGNNGCWTSSDKNYFSGGTGIGRKTFRPLN